MKVPPSVVKVEDIPVEYKRVTDEVYEYGTAGFRRKASDLPFVMYRMGMVAGLRARVVSKAVGLMITASHNPAEDNGVKLIEPMGEMLVISWEKIACRIVNATDTELNNVLQAVVDGEKIDMNAEGRVFTAYDTRPTSPDLEKAVNAGVQAVRAKSTSFGLLTTPQLHYIVRCENSGNYGEPTEAGYYKKYSNAFKVLNQGIESKDYRAKVWVDGANGVGASKLSAMAEHIGNDLLNVVVVNSGDGVLNHKCGADYVKIAQKAPCMSGETGMETGQRWASLDGDADRILYYFMDAEGGFHLLDGDRIAVLISVRLRELVERLGILESVNFGVVQTAYANGASTKYLEDVLKVPVFCVSTGVKNLHNQAETLDVGIYFEANGHGTVLFSDAFKTKVNELRESGQGDSANSKIAEDLWNLISLVNETVGDAVADMLLVETILRGRDWNEKEWHDMYKDLPNRQLKVPVPDRNMIKTKDAERRVTEPSSLQTQIDEKVGTAGPNSRAFVRPSGTEDVVRVYAEAETQEKAEQLAEEVKNAVVSTCSA